MECQQIPRTRVGIRLCRFLTRKTRQKVSRSLLCRMINRNYKATPRTSEFKQNWTKQNSRTEYRIAQHSTPDSRTEQNRTEQNRVSIGYTHSYTLHIHIRYFNRIEISSTDKVDIIRHSFLANISLHSPAFLWLPTIFSYNPIPDFGRESSKFHFESHFSKLQIFHKKVISFSTVFFSYLLRHVWIILTVKFLRF